MNNYDWDGLSRKIQFYAGNRIKDELLKEIEHILKISGWNYAKRAVFELSKRETCPSNLYGFFENKLREYEIEEKYKQDMKMTWKIDSPDYVSHIEWELFFLVIIEMLLWSQLKISDYNTMNTHFTNEYKKLNGMDNKVRENFLGEYLNKLVSARSKRISELTIKNKSKINNPQGDLK